MERMKLLFTSDLHLGRTPTRLPAAWRGTLRTLQSWDRLVGYACSEKVDALVLGGDVVDESNRYWEVLGAFQAGAERLHAAGIRLIAVAGNHDADVLPRLADSLGPEKLTLLGRGGVWESVVLSSPARPECVICGWSFPSRHFHEDPLLEWREPETSLPVLGLVHGDAGAARSSYAPLSMERMAALPVSGWLLGHVHTPRLEGATPWILMPGSPMPLDPGEPGPHHAWRLQIENGAVSTPLPCLPAPLRYETLALDLENTDDAEDAALHGALLQRTDAFDAAHLVLRVLIRGKLKPSPLLRERLRNLRELEIAPHIHMDTVEDHLSESALDEHFSTFSPALGRAWEALNSGQAPTALSASLQELETEINRHPVFAGLPPALSAKESLDSVLKSLERQLSLALPNF